MCAVERRLTRFPPQTDASVTWRCNIVRRVPECSCRRCRWDQPHRSRSSSQRKSKVFWDGFQSHLSGFCSGGFRCLTQQNRLTFSFYSLKGKYILGGFFCMINSTKLWTKSITRQTWSQVILSFLKQFLKSFRSEQLGRSVECSPVHLVNLRRTLKCGSTSF